MQSVQIVFLLQFLLFAIFLRILYIFNMYMISMHTGIKMTNLFYLQLQIDMLDIMFLVNAKSRV